METNQYRQAREEKLQKLRALGVEVYPAKAARTHGLEEGLAARDAVITACKVRLRPILMTDLATIIGLMPMAVKMGEGSAFRRW